MEAISTLPYGRHLSQLRRIDWSAVSTWLLGFGLVVYLGLKGGGYDPLVQDQVGVGVWWVLLAMALVGALPRYRLGALAWSALGLLGAFVIWTALSLTWTVSSESTHADLARVLTYLGVFVVALFDRSPRGARRMATAAGAGITVIALVGLLSRLHPAWFNDAAQTGQFLSSSRERLSFPVNYWNALAALVAIGLPLLLYVATCAKSILPRAVAAAALPAMTLTIFLTLSRGGMAAAVVALAIFLALTNDRLPKLLTLLVSFGGSAILIVALTQRNALHHGLLEATARHQGNELLAMTIVVCAGVGLLQAGISLGLRHGLRPRWSLVSPRQSLAVVLSGLLVLIVACAALGAPGRVSRGWHDFKNEGGPGEGAGRLTSVAGEGRYQFWRSAAREGDTKLLTGTGSGTFENWWDRKGDIDVTVRDAHSLYMQTLGELGIGGLLLLGAFLLTVLIGGTRATLRAGSRGRPQLAAAVAGCLAFCMTAAFDWMWQIPLLPVILLLLAAVLVTSDTRQSGGQPFVPPLLLRIGTGAAAIAAIVSISIPLASTAALRDSQAEARNGGLAAALDAAKTAENAQPGAVTPRLQQALLLEARGDLALAAAAARSAADLEPTNWRPWLVLSRIDAERGVADAAVRSYRKARSLYPRFSLFSS